MLSHPPVKNLGSAEFMSGWSLYVYHSNFLSFLPFHAPFPTPLDACCIQTPRALRPGVQPERLAGVWPTQYPSQPTMIIASQ